MMCANRFEEAGLIGRKPANVDHLITLLLTHSDWSIRGEAARQLGAGGDRRAVEPLLTALRDPKYQVQMQVIGALGQIRDPRILEPLLELFPQTAHTHAVGRVLGWLGDDRAVEPMLDALSADTPLMRSSAADALGHLGDKRAIDPLIEALKDENKYVRQAAAIALGNLGSSQAVEPLIEALADPSGEVSPWVAGALGQIGDARSVEPLIQILMTDTQFSFYAAIALGEIGDKRATTPLIRAVQGHFGSKGLREVAAGALGKVGGDGAFEALMMALNDDDEGVRFYAAEGLGYLGDPRSLPELLKAQQHDDGCHELGTVKDAATEAIERIQQDQGHQN